MTTNRFMTMLILLALCACSSPDATPLASHDEPTPTSTSVRTPTTQDTAMPTPTPAYQLGEEPDFSVVLHMRPSDLPPGDYLLYQLVHPEGPEWEYRYAYTSFDGKLSGPLFDLIAPEGGSYSITSYFPHSEDLKQDLRFIYDRRFEIDSGFLFINLEDGTIQQLASGCENGWYSLPNLVTPYALFVCEDDLYLISIGTWEVEQIPFSYPYPGEEGFVIDWVSPDLVWFGDSEWRRGDNDYAYCTLRISSRHFECHRDLPSFAYKIDPLSEAGPTEQFEAYYESFDGDISGVALFPIDYLENPLMAMSLPENLPFTSSLDWFPIENKYLTIDSNYQRTEAALWMYDVDSHQATEICEIPERLIPGMRGGFWSPDGNHTIEKVEIFTGDMYIQEVWQFSIITGEIEQLAPNIRDMRIVIGYFQVP